MRSVKTALAAGLVVTAVAVGVVLSQSPLVVLAANSTSRHEQLAAARRSANVCQAGERLPQGTSAIRLSLGAFTGPAVKIKVIVGAAVVTSGERGSDWDGQRVTVPVKVVSGTLTNATICISMSEFANEEVLIFGTRSARDSARTGNGAALQGRMRIEYLGTGRSSWLALIPSVARHMGLGRAWSGTWIALLVVILMLAATIQVSRLIVRELNE